MLVIADDLLRRPGVEHRGSLELGDDALELLGDASGLAPLFPLALEALATNITTISMTADACGAMLWVMEARDFRSIGRAAQEALRRRALFLIEEQGLSQAQAAEAVGVQRQTVNIWLQRYRDQGEAGVLDGRRVSPRRGKGLLTADEAGRVRGWIADKMPDQLKLPFALWTSRAVRDLIAAQRSASGSACRRCSSICSAGA